MKANTPVLVFGEVLYDCFPGGEQVLGGAPFNVAWHLQALGDQPHFISSVGNDELGQKILRAMHDWNMDTQSMQIDPVHKTGQVEVNLINNQPQYTITPNCAYDFISDEAIKTLPDSGILYHGTLGLRNDASRFSLRQLVKKPGLSVFLDVNLRAPWWQQQEVFEWLEHARWVKVNDEELHLLGFDSNDICESMQQLQTQFQIEHIIVTQGEKGAIVLTDDGRFHQKTPATVDQIIDTVGAGDGFSALYIHGLRVGWPMMKTLATAQQFAEKIIGLRGATTTENDFYRDFVV